MALTISKDSMLSKKNFITHLLAISILCIEFLLCRYVFFDIHRMKQMPVLLLGLGMLFVAVSFFLKCKVAPIVIAVGYMIGFVAGVVFEADSVDAGGASTNNLWIIWTVVFVGFVVLGGFVVKIIKSRKKVTVRKSDEEQGDDKNITREAFDHELELLLQKAEALIPEELLSDLPYMKEVPDVHDWYMFERELWDVGEDIRQLTIKYKKKLDKSQLDRIVNICLDKRAKRGRQSFVLLLGRKSYADCADRIVTILEDADVEGQVITTLYMLQAGQYVELMKPFLNHKQTWIKNEAKRYIQKFE